jgi:hypothetical protein
MSEEVASPMKVTFDTNTFDKASRPEVYRKDPMYETALTVHEALRRGAMRGYICETALTLEGVRRDDRSAVFGSTVAVASTERVSEDTLQIASRTEQPERKPVSVKQAERFRAAFDLGLRLLATSRIAMPRAEEQFYAEENADEIGPRLDRGVRLAGKIEARGLGCRRAMVLAERLIKNRLALGQPWFHGLRYAHGIAEVREVARAVAEWADGDSVAAHYAYGNDVFCTLDHGRDENRRGESAVLDVENRKWLTLELGIQFATMDELAVRLA